MAMETISINNKVSKNINQLIHIPAAVNSFSHIPISSHMDLHGRAYCSV